MTLSHQLQDALRQKPSSDDFEWTGIGCDVCGFGTVESVDEFDPHKPCPECGVVMVPQTEDLDAAFEASLEERKGDTGPLSNVKKKSAPNMWYIAKAGSGWVVSIGDPRKGGSKTKRTFHKKDDLLYWAKHEMPDQVSPNHVIDMTRLKLVSPFYTQWYVDNMLNKGKK